MNTLPEILINKIMLYVSRPSHPCADVMKTCLCDYVEDGLMLKTKRKFIPKLDCYTMGFFEIKYNTSEDDEHLCEYNVIQRHIYNKLKVCMISVADVLRLCPEYVRFNKSIINEILIEDEERIIIHAEETRDEEDDSDYYDSDDLNIDYNRYQDRLFQMHTNSSC